MSGILDWRVFTLLVGGFRILGDLSLDLEDGLGYPETMFTRLSGFGSSKSPAGCARRG